MNLRSALIGLLGSFAAPSVAAAPAQPGPDIVVQRFGVLVLAEDLELSADFYGRLFGSEPEVRTATLVAFDVAGGLFAVASRDAYGREALSEGAVRPYIKVSDLVAAYAHLRATAPESLQTEIVEEGPFSFFRLADPDDNIIEFFAVAAARP